MNEVEAAGKILDSMLGKLGFQVKLETTVTDDGPCLNILTNEGVHLIGKHGKDTHRNGEGNGTPGG